MGGAIDPSRKNSAWGVPEYIGSLKVRLATPPAGSTAVPNPALAGLYLTRIETTSTVSPSASFLAGVAQEQTTAVDRWKSLLSGASNYEAFQQVGHCLFALLAGLTGAMISRRFHAVRERGRPARDIGAGGGVMTTDDFAAPERRPGPSGAPCGSLT